MNQLTAHRIQEEITLFSLPSYNEIPNVGLFLEQVSKYISEYTEPLGCVTLTGSMISNYVKKKLLSNPIRKQYDREQIAALFFIAAAKTVLSLEDIQLMLELSREQWSPEQAYAYFRSMLKVTLGTVCGTDVSDESAADIEAYGSETPDLIDLKLLLHKVLLAVSHKVYLEKSFRFMREDLASE